MIIHYIKKLSLGKLFSSVLLLFLVLLWIIPTVGLFVSSLRDKDQLAITGWWTALSTTEMSEFRRTGTKDDQVRQGGNYIITGNFLDEGGKIIQTFSTSFRNLTEYNSGETAKFKDGSIFTLHADGDSILYCGSSSNIFSGQLSRSTKGRGCWTIVHQYA